MSKKINRAKAWVKIGDDGLIDPYDLSLYKNKGDTCVRIVHDSYYRQMLVAMKELKRLQHRTYDDLIREQRQAEEHAKYQRTKP